MFLKTTLTLRKLMRTIDIVTPHDYDGNFKRLEVRMYQHLCRSFAGGIWIRWRKYACLQQVVVIILNFAIHLVYFTLVG